MKKYLLFAVIFILNIFFLYSADNVNVGGGKIVKINNYVITEDELNTKYNFFLKSIPAGNPKPTKKEVLTELINNQLISQEMRAQKSLIPNQKELEGILNNNKYMFLRQKKSENPKYEFSEADYKKFIEDEFKVTYEKYLDTIKDQMLFRQYITKRMQSKMDAINLKKYDKPSDFPVTATTEFGVEKFNSIKEFYERVKTTS
jgi:SurA N-terminal domain